MVRVLSLLSLENGCHNSHSKSKIREICKVTLCLGRDFTSNPQFHPERLPICKVSKFCWNRAEQGASDAYIAQDEIITAVRLQWRHNSEVSNPGWIALDTNFDAPRSFRPHLKPKGVAYVKLVYDLWFWGCLTCFSCWYRRGPMFGRRFVSMNPLLFHTDCQFSVTNARFLASSEGYSTVVHSVQ
jgi:hypothetical protein